MSLNVGSRLGHYEVTALIGGETDRQPFDTMLYMAMGHELIRLLPDDDSSGSPKRSLDALARLPELQEPRTRLTVAWPTCRRPMHSVVQ